MNKTLITIDVDGRITSRIDVFSPQADNYPDMVDATATFVEGATHYINGQFLKQPIQPALSYMWDSDSFSWKPDPELEKQLLDISARTTRDKLFSQSDWTQLPDVSLSTREKWLEYRQGLRDITLQASYPFQITWPTPPN